MNLIIVTQICLKVPLVHVFKHLLHISEVDVVHREEGCET